MHSWTSCPPLEIQIPVTFIFSYEANPNAAGMGEILLKHVVPHIPAAMVALARRNLILSANDLLVHCNHGELIMIKKLTHLCYGTIRRSVNLRYRRAVPMRDIGRALPSGAVPFNHCHPLPGMTLTSRVRDGISISTNRSREQEAPRPPVSA